MHDRYPMTSFNLIANIAISILFLTISPCLAHDNATSREHSDTINTFNSISGETSHFLGRIKILDYLPPLPSNGVKQNISALHNSNIPSNLSSLLTHAYSLINTSDKSLTVQSIETSCTCIKAQLKYSSQGETINIIPPKAKFEIEVTIDPYKVHSGMLDERIYIRGGDRNTIHFTLRLKAIIDNGVAFGINDKSEDILKFPGMFQGQQLTRFFNLTLDSRFPCYLDAGTKFKLVSMHPAIELTLISANPLKRISGKRAAEVEIEDEVMSFTKEQESLSQDCVLTYSVKISKDAPVGSFNNVLALVANKPTQYGFLNRITIPIKGSVIARNKVK